MGESPPLQKNKNMRTILLSNGETIEVQNKLRMFNGDQQVGVIFSDGSEDWVSIRDIELPVELYELRGLRDSLERDFAKAKRVSTAEEAAELGSTEYMEAWDDEETLVEVEIINPNCEDRLMDAFVPESLALNLMACAELRNDSKIWNELRNAEFETELEASLVILLAKDLLRELNVYAFEYFKLDASIGHAYYSDDYNYCIDYLHVSEEN